MKKHGYAIMTALLPPLLCGILTAILLFGLGNWIGSFSSLLGEETGTLLSSVFGQLKHAELRVYLIPGFLLFGVFSLLLFWGIRSRSVRLCVGIPVGILLFLFTLFLTVWFTDVNGIRVGDIARSLIRLSQNGLFGAIAS